MVIVKLELLLDFLVLLERRTLSDLAAIVFTASILSFDFLRELIPV